MKKFIVLFVLLLSATCFAQNSNNNACSITVNGKTIPLYGRVQIVPSNADFRVQVVTSFPDLRIEKVISNANHCGQWEFVSSNADFTIEFVSVHADLKIEFVKSFPGIP